jgi:hypothetical protein
MNQAIHFPERQEWRGDLSCLIFPALVNGIIINCRVPLPVLSARFGSELSIERLIESFIAERWDFEDAAEQLINQGAGDDSGYIVLD